MNEYLYSGPVLEFGKLLTDKWEGFTIAVSEKKARSNLIYQFKKGTNRVASSKITLPGKIFLVGKE